MASALRLLCLSWTCRKGSLALVAHAVVPCACCALRLLCLALVVPCACCASAGPAGGGACAHVHTHTHTYTHTHTHSTNTRHSACATSVCIAHPEWAQMYTCVCVCVCVCVCGSVCARNNMVLVARTSSAYVCTWPWLTGTSALVHKREGSREPCLRSVAQPCMHEPGLKGFQRKARHMVQAWGDCTEPLQPI